MGKIVLNDQTQPEQKFIADRIKGSFDQPPPELEFGVDMVYVRSNISEIELEHGFKAYEYDEERYSFPEYVAIQQKVIDDTAAILNAALGICSEDAEAMPVEDILARAEQFNTAMRLAVRNVELTADDAALVADLLPPEEVVTVIKRGGD